MLIQMEKKKEMRRDKKEKADFSLLLKHRDVQSVTVTSSIPPELEDGDKDKRKKEGSSEG